MGRVMELDMPLGALVQAVGARAGLSWRTQPGSAGLQEIITPGPLWTMCNLGAMRGGAHNRLVVLKAPAANAKTRTSSSAPLKNSVFNPCGAEPTPNRPAGTWGASG